MKPREKQKEKNPQSPLNDGTLAAMNIRKKDLDLSEKIWKLQNVLKGR